MRYGRALRERVVQYIEDGGGVIEASRRYEVGRSTIYKWLAKGEDYLEHNRPGPKSRRKIDVEALSAAIEAKPDALQIEHAVTFGVHKSTICRAMKSLKISRKKNVGVP